MSIYIEKDCDVDLGFDCGQVIKQVVNAALKFLSCPYPAELSVILTNDDRIHKMNQEFRGIDRATDVLSFPMTEYETPGQFPSIENEPECFNPDTGELLLGDIVVSIDRVIAQAEEYNHSARRELAFLIAHSMLHLSGYDHIKDEERLQMEKMQEDILTGIGIGRNRQPDL